MPRQTFISLFIAIPFFSFPLFLTMQSLLPAIFSMSLITFITGYTFSWLSRKEDDYEFRSTLVFACMGLSLLILVFLFLFTKGNPFSIAWRVAYVALPQFWPVFFLSVSHTTHLHLLAPLAPTLYTLIFAAGFDLNMNHTTKLNKIPFHTWTLVIGAMLFAIFTWWWTAHGYLKV